MTNYQTITDLFGRESYTRISSPKSKKEATKPEKTIEYIRKGKKKISVRESCIVSHIQFENPKFTNEERNKNLLSQCGNDNQYNGYMSPNTAKKIRKLLYVLLKAGEHGSSPFANKKMMVDYNEYYPTFVTLTLPAKQRHTDYELKELLGQFLKWVQGERTELKNGQFKGQLKGFGVETYLWRAEVQKNGNIHFHVLLDRFVPWERIRSKWNSLLDNLGYIQDYAQNQREKHQNGFQIDENALIQDMKRIEEEAAKCLKAKQINERTPDFLVKILKKAIEYNRTALELSIVRKLAIEKQKITFGKNQKEGWRNPNSTDIHAIRDIDNLAAYVAKYISKSPKKVEYTPQKNEIIKLNTNSGKMEIWKIPNEIFNPGKTYLTFEFMGLATEFVAEVPEFEERKIEGRLWGCSKNIQNLERQIFAEIVEEYEEIFYSDGTKEPLKTTQNKEVAEFVAQITALIGKEEIEEATKRVGEGFELYGAIIPLNKDKFGIKKRQTKKGKMKYPHVSAENLLKQQFPKISNKIKAHYRGIYNNIYASTA